MSQGTWWKPERVALAWPEALARAHDKAQRPA
eukprot:CAMPEP_0179055162 /NCGR_PEP_ID=MMETSP0796-20121207/23158_1 /TAXON_ID=73915 /ORGANISM="Pyrodinium bahamense, Strain pbaha01" /LENGTH=31 /DNA_ID= /DNA_START= /DNA_END= /DNA_ORIENTATION=